MPQHAYFRVFAIKTRHFVGFFVFSKFESWVSANRSESDLSSKASPNKPLDKVAFGSGF
jgi:hypothetical protein